MKSLLKNLYSTKCTGLYVGASEIFSVTSLRSLKSWKVLSYSATADKNQVSAFSCASEELGELKNNLTELLSKCERHDVFQVAFDDLYVRFFVLPQNEKPEKGEINNILRWHAEKALKDAANYIYTSQLVTASNGYRIYGAAIKSELIQMIDEAFKNHGCTWYMADSACSYIWNDISNYRDDCAAAYIILRSSGWTLMAHDNKGLIEMIKPGRWAPELSVEANIRRGMIEANRLLTTLVDKRPELFPEKIHIMAGSYPESDTYAKEIFGDRVFLIENQPFGDNLSSTMKLYANELQIAKRASVLQ